MKCPKPYRSWLRHLDHGSGILQSMFRAAVSRKAQRTMPAVGDEGQNFRDCGVLGRQGLHLAQPLGENSGSVKQLLIERPYEGQSFARELAALHADDVEALEAGIL